jgi:acylphosphatase
VSDAVVAAEIVIEGVVQGVGFREYTRRRASMLALAGDVVNLPDGRVRVRVEGPRAAIEALVRELVQGPRLARVRDVQVEWRESTGRSASFTIRELEPGA